MSAAYPYGDETDLLKSCIERSLMKRPVWIMASRSGITGVPRNRIICHSSKYIIWPGDTRTHCNIASDSHYLWPDNVDAARYLFRYNWLWQVQLICCRNKISWVTKKCWSKLFRVQLERHGEFNTVVDVAQKNTRSGLNLKSIQHQLGNAILLIELIRLLVVSFEVVGFCPARSMTN